MTLEIGHKPYEKRLTETPRCPHCGASMKKRWERLSPGLVAILIEFGKTARNKDRIHLHVSRDLTLSSIQYTKFSALKYFGVVQKGDDSGYWRLTEKGMDFLANRIGLPIEVCIFRNRVCERSEELINIADIMTSSSREYWQKEFPFRIKMSKIVPVDVPQTVRLFEFDPSRESEY